MVADEVISELTEHSAGGSPINPLIRWHHRLGHQGINVLRTANQEYNLDIPLNALNTSMASCIVCIQSKSTRSQIHRAADPQYNAQRVLHILHSDLSGPMSVSKGKKKIRCPTIGQYLYALVIIDEYSHTVFVELLRDKSETAALVIHIIDRLHIQTQYYVMRFHSDGGGEYKSKELKEQMDVRGITLTHTTADTPQHNGVAERINRTLFELVRSFLIHAQAPPELWGEALLWAAFLYNVTPHAVTNNTAPLVLLRNYRFDLKKLRVWGCDAYVLKLSSQQSKLEPRTRAGVFVGYDEASASYRIMDPNTLFIMKSRDVKFDETSFTQLNQVKARSGHGNFDRRNYQFINPFSTAEDEQLDDNGLWEEEMPSPSSDIEVVKKPNSDATDEADEATSRTSSAESEATSRPSGAGSEAIDANESKGEESTTNECDLKDGHAAGQKVEEERDNRIEPNLSKVSKQARTLITQFNSWSRKHIVPTESRLGRVTRNGRAIVPPPDRPAASDPNNYDPVDMHRALTDRVNLFIEQDECIQQCEQASLFIQQDLDAEEYIFSALLPGTEPAQYKDAIKSPEADEWKAAMREEYSSLEKLGVWKIVPCPEGVTPLKGRWVFKNKLGEENQLVRRKARFVAKGYLQSYGRDFFETHAPVAKMKSIKMVLSIVASQDLELHQLDFDTAFLNATVEEDIYMEQPEGFYQGDTPKLVLKLIKALYGLKQAPRQWNATIDAFMQKLSWKPLRSDSCVYIKLTRSNRLMILCLYVDDTIVAFDKEDREEWFADKKTIADTYAIKDLGECNWILNMKVTRNRDTKTTTLSQQAYVERMINQFGINEARRLSSAVPITTSDLSQPPNKTKAIPLEADQFELYRSMIGSLLYAANITRVDICFAVAQLCRYTAAPCQHHMQAAQDVFRYLRDTPNRCLLFGRRQHPNSSPRLEIFTDSDWASDRSDRKSTTGCVVRFNNDIINWLSKKQKSVAVSTAEAEYMAMAEGVKEALWCRSWIAEVFNIDVCARLRCDNTAANNLGKNDVIHDRSKHIDIRYHFIRDEQKKEHINVMHVKSCDNQADILTKAVGKQIHHKLRDLLTAVS